RPRLLSTVPGVRRPGGAAVLVLGVRAHAQQHVLPGRHGRAAARPLLVVVGRDLLGEGLALVQQRALRAALVAPARHLPPPLRGPGGPGLLVGLGALIGGRDIGLLVLADGAGL